MFDLVIVKWFTNRKIFDNFQEEERKARLGPGGLDPVEVFESLPEVIPEFALKFPIEWWDSYSYESSIGNDTTYIESEH